jgi:hypothetical protein
MGEPARHGERQENSPEQLNDVEAADLHSGGDVLSRWRRSSEQ